VRIHHRFNDNGAIDRQRSVEDRAAGRRIIDPKACVAAASSGFPTSFLDFT
jgi:hypothetical protein